MSAGQGFLISSLNEDIRETKQDLRDYPKPARQNDWNRMIKVICRIATEGTTLKTVNQTGGILPSPPTMFKVKTLTVRIFSLFWDWGF